MCMMSLAKAVSWILDEGEASPFEDPRYQHAAGNYDGHNRITVLSYCYSYGTEALLSTRYLIEAYKEKWPQPLMHCAEIVYHMSDINREWGFDDPFLPKDGWFKLLIGDDRSKLCDVKGQQIYQTKSDEALPKEYSTHDS